MTKEIEVTFNCRTSPVPEQMKTATSEDVEAAVASGQIRLADLKEHRHYVIHVSQQQQE